MDAVLLVDEDADAFEEIVARASREVVVVDSLVDALQILELARFDRVVLGRLPGDDAAELVRLMREHPRLSGARDTPVLRLDALSAVRPRAA